MSTQQYTYNELQDKLTSLCTVYFEPYEQKKVEQALQLVCKKSDEIKRASGEPYIMHPLRVAIIALDEIKLGVNSVIAALLHDVVFDNHLPIEQVEQLYGSDVTTILQGLGKISRLYTEKLSLNTENFIALLLTITSDVRIVLVKLADRLDNIRAIKNFETSKQLSIATETRLLYAPIAHRLGLYHIKSELEDISLRHIDPENYYSIARKLKDTKKQREDYIEQFSAPIKKILDQAGIKYEIKGRPKSVNSIYGKVVKKDIDISEIFDLFAIRVILDNVEKEHEKDACWHIYSLVTNIYTPNPTRLRDWISTPRPSGYESLHTTVIGPDNHWVEVQIRTRRMDEIAEKGDAAHWKYKESGKGETHDQWLRTIRDVLEQKNPEFIEKTYSNQKTESLTDIFIFTPQGDIKKLRGGSTILDFAYSIHSNIGNQCTGAKVNDRIVPIKHKLQNGDTVEIITSKNQKPKIEWLNIAVSSRAKTKIKRAISENEFRQAELGKEMLERKLSHIKIEPDEQALLKAINQFKYKRALDFYQDIADEKLDVQKVKDFIVESLNNDEKETVSQTDASAGEYVHHQKNTDNLLIIDQNITNIDYKLAKCCHPIPGDKIFGFVTVDRGIQIHRQTCPNAADMKARYPYRVLPAQWTDEKIGSSFDVDIIVTGIDRIGIISHISEVISKDHKVKIRSIAINTKDGVFQGFITIFVNNLDHLDSLLANINKIKGVLKAERLDKI